MPHEMPHPVGNFKRLLDHLSAAVMVLDEHLRVAYVNPAAEHLFATSMTSLVGMPLEHIWWETGRQLQAFRQALADLHPFTKREAQMSFPQASNTMMIDYSVTPVVDEDHAKGLLIELRPLDKLLKMTRDDSLVAAHQATRALVRGVAHEVKNPLGGIRGAAQLLARELADPHLQEYTEIIISETDRLRNLVDMMLGPRKPLQFAHLNVHQITEHVRALIHAEIGDAIVIERDYDPSLPEIVADHDQLIQALINIVRNACQALSENPREDSGRVIIRTRAVRKYTIGNVRHRLAVLIEVEDNGPGIPAALSETLFYPMVSGRAQGTGLGLSIAQSIVTQHRGALECDSRPGLTIFRLILPIDLPTDS